MIAMICDRCGKGYGVTRFEWPNKTLCPCCDLSTPPPVRIAYMHTLEHVGRAA